MQFMVACLRLPAAAREEDFELLGKELVRKCSGFVSLQHSWVLPGCSRR